MPQDLKALYDSGWHHPFAAYLAGFGLILALVRRMPFLQGFLTLFTVEILADALVTGAWSPVRSTSPLFTPLSVVFVILGDLRVFVLAEKLTRPDATLGQLLKGALPVALAVPVLTGVGSKIVPALAEPRMLFFVYEVLLFGVVLGMRRFVYAPRLGEGVSAKAMRDVTTFVAVQYAGWALADAVLLAGAPIGHLLRIAPNVLYYAAFLPFVYAVVPERATEAAT